MMNATHTVTGSTYPARQIIALAGGEWDGANKRWLLDDAGADRLRNTLRAPGGDRFRNLSIKRIAAQPLAGWDRTVSEYRG